jgi:hypothetical protein
LHAEWAGKPLLHVLLQQRPLQQQLGQLHCCWVGIVAVRQPQQVPNGCEGTATSGL